ncbi:TetR/AcrR family transcriptional regulator [Paenibacillus montanisoli]|uniref:TetR/AcrR family transcriptional regulator n=1 Tax=Paenibacillus montanisoli TaxID=2081970 RepID=UPI001403C875|nr:TetR family transcriptional regulator [Paenibacillus montanisoli]
MKKNKFQLKREATYQLLIEAGMLCFSEKGYAATTLGDIVARTGHTKGAFYGHFESKEQLFLEILDYQLQLTTGWTDVPKAYSPAHTTLEEVLMITLKRLGEMMKGVTNWIVVLTDFYQSTRQNPEVQRKLKEKYREWVAGIVILIRVLQERGWISEDKDVHRIAVQVIALNEGYIIYSHLFDGADSRAHLSGLVKLMT